MLGWKTTSAPSAPLSMTSIPGPLPLQLQMQMQFLEKNRESLALQQPEEPTDNWDDDFEEGISFTKLQGIVMIFFSIVKGVIHDSFFFFFFFPRWDG